MKKILIIEDDESVRKLYQVMLEMEGFDVTTADCGEEGLRQFWRGEFDLIITDLFMPGVDGLYVASKIREINETIPILGISGGPNPNSVNRRLFDSGTKAVSQVFKKPVEIEELVREIKKRLEL